MCQLFNKLRVVDLEVRKAAFRTPRKGNKRVVSVKVKMKRLSEGEKERCDR